MTTAYLHPAAVAGRLYLAPSAVPAANTVSLAAANSTETATSSTGAAAVTTAAKVVNLIGAPSNEASTSSAGSATVTQPGVGVPVAIDISQISPARVVVFEGSGSRVVVFD